MEVSKIIRNSIEYKKCVFNGIEWEVPSGPQIEMVDLGLSVLWAKTNIGAQTETDCGQYFQWAATTPLHVEGSTVNPAADWSLCPYTDDGQTFTKYDGSDYDTLQSEDDAATVILGAGYRMPTQAEFQELIDETDKEWVEDFNGSGVNGYKFINKNDSSKYIFLPTAGNCNGSTLNDVGRMSGYLSSNLYIPYSTSSAWTLIFSVYNTLYVDGNLRCTGSTIRPVRTAN